MEGHRLDGDPVDPRLGFGEMPEDGERVPGHRRVEVRPRQPVADLRPMPVAVRGMGMAVIAVGVVTVVVMGVGVTGMVIVGVIVPLRAVLLGRGAAL